MGSARLCPAARARGFARRAAWTVALLLASLLLDSRAQAAPYAAQLGTPIGVGEFQVVVDSWIPGGAGRGFAPIRVRATNDGPETEQLEIRLSGSMNYRSQSRWQTRKVRLEPGESTSFEMLAGIDRPSGRGSYNLQLFSGDDQHFLNLGIAEQTLHHSARVIGFLGDAKLSDVQIAGLRSALPMAETVRGVFGAGRRGSMIQVAQLFSLGFEDLPGKTVAWSSVDTVMVDVDRIVPSDARWQRLFEWVHQGGQLVFVGADLGGRLRGLDGLAALRDERFRITPSSLKSIAGTGAKVPRDLEGKISLYRAGFGTLALLELEPDEADGFFLDAGAPATPAPAAVEATPFVQALLALDAACTHRGDSPSMLAATYAASSPATGSPWTRLFPEDGLPLRTVLAFLLLFSVLVGPLSVAYSRKKERPGLLLVAVPLVSLLATVGVVGFGILRQGLGTEGFAHSLSIVDQVEKRASSALRRELIMGRGGQTLQPLPSTTVMVPAEEEFSGVRSIQEDGNQLELSGDFLPVRTRTRHVAISTGTTRARLEWSAPNGDSMEITNALGVELEALEVMSPDGRVFRASGGVPKGASATLQAESAPAVRQIFEDAGLDPIFSAARLRPSGYLAVAAEAGPGVDDASVKMKEMLRFHGIVGYLDDRPAKWNLPPSGGQTK